MDRCELDTCALIPYQWSLLMEEPFKMRWLNGLMPVLKPVMPVFLHFRSGIVCQEMFSCRHPIILHFVSLIHLSFTLCCFCFICRITPISRSSNSPSVRFTYSTAVLLWWYHLPWVWTKQFPAATALQGKAFLRHPNVHSCSNMFLVKHQVLRKLIVLVNIWWSL